MGSKKAPEDVVLDNLKEYCLNPDSTKLSPKEKEMFDRWDVADNLLRQYPNRKDAASMMMEKFKGISRASAYRDLYNAQRLFGSMSRYDKNYWRDYLVNDILEVIKICKNQSPADVRNINAAHSNLIKTLQLDKDDPEIDIDKLEQHNYYLVANIGGQSMKMDLSKMYKLPVDTKAALAGCLSDEITEDIACEIINHPND